MKKTLLGLVAVAALMGAALTAGHIGNVFEEKSLWSYVAKTGDNDTRSQAAVAHIEGAKRYGLVVALELALCSAIVGAFIMAAWLRRKDSKT